MIRSVLAVLLAGGHFQGNGLQHGATAETLADARKSEHDASLADAASTPELVALDLARGDFRQALANPGSFHLLASFEPGFVRPCT